MSKEEHGEMQEPELRRLKTAPAEILTKGRSRLNKKTSEASRPRSEKIDINTRMAIIKEVDVAYGRVMLLGASAVGKTSLLRGLKNERFIQYGTSTQVADVRQVNQFWAEGRAQMEWKEVSEADELNEMAKLLAAGSHDSKSAEQIISSVKSVKELYMSSYEEATSAEHNTETGLSQTHRIQSYLEKAIDHAQHLTPEDVCDLKPAPFLHVWDCGGQQVFLEVLPAFLTPRTMFLTLFDASKSFDETFHSVQLRRGNKVVEEDVGVTILQLIDTWMSMIHTYLSKKEKGVLLDYPRISMIGTHGDQLIDEEKRQECQRRMDKLKSEFELIQSSYIVDNTTAGKGKDGEDPSYAELRAEIYDFTANSLVVNTPVSWVLYRKVMQMFTKASKNFISYKEAKAIAIACKIADEDVQKALAFYHDLGVILYYPQVEGLRDKVILSPKWFVECLGKVLSLEGNEEYKMPGMWKLLREKGILLQSLYGAVWRNNEGGIDPESIMKLLVHLHLAAEVNTEQYPDRDILQYFVPCVLKNFVGDIHSLAVEMQLMSSPLHVKFNTSFVPPGYFTRFASTMASYKVCTLDFKHGIYRNRVSFEFGEGVKYDRVTFTELPDAIQVDIGRNAPDTGDYPSFSKSCQNLLTLVKASCEEVEELYHQSMMNDSSCPIKIYSRLKVVCKSEECLKPNVQVHYLNIDDVAQQELTTNDCCSCERNVTFRHFCYGEKYWFPSTLKVTKKGRLSQQEMLKLSFEIENGENLAACLEMFGCWKQLTSDHKVQNKILHLLYAFDNGAGQRDTLIRVLKELNYNHLADQLAVEGTADCVAPTTSRKILMKRKCTGGPLSSPLTPAPVTPSNLPPSATRFVFPHIEKTKLKEQSHTSEFTLESVKEDQVLQRKTVSSEVSHGHASSGQEIGVEASLQDHDLTRCSQHITIPCNTLAGYLDIEDSVVAQIQSKFSGNCVHMYHILKMWVDQQPRPTKQEAYEKLIALGQENAAKSLMDPNFKSESTESTPESHQCTLI